MFYKKILKPLFFRMDAERIHHLTIRFLRYATRVPGGQRLFRALYAVPDVPSLQVKRFGLTFNHPLGLAAGLDKNAEAVPAFSAIGLAFMEVGTLTPKPQAGNELPRLFRLPGDRALINRMGFNNVGARQAARTLTGALPKMRLRVPVGVNIGKNKTTPNEQAIDDYCACVRELFVQADFFVVNISSPNTPDLRNLQYGDELQRLLAAIKQEVIAQARVHNCEEKPILVKIAPDMEQDDLKAVVAVIVQSGVAGIVATNTTVRRDGLAHPNKKETGGLSGVPVRALSTQFIRLIYRWTNGQLPIIGSGGVFDADDAYEKIRAGAALIEMYTGLIYEGPEIVAAIHRGLRERMARDGFTNIEQAIGADHREQMGEQGNGGVRADV